MSLEKLRLPFIHLRRDHTGDIDPRKWVCPLLTSALSAQISCIAIPLELHYHLADDLEEEDESQSFYRQLDQIDWKKVDELLLAMQKQRSLLKVEIELSLMEYDFHIAKPAMERLLPECVSSKLNVEVKLWKSGTGGF